MEEYIETIITILIGLGALLISAVRKKGEPQSAAAQFDGADNLFGVDNQEAESEILDQVFETEATNEFNNTINSQAMSKNFASINDPPTGDETSATLSGDGNIRKILGQPFNARRAIIYHEIINRKHF